MDWQAKQPGVTPPRNVIEHLANVMATRIGFNAAVSGLFLVIMPITIHFYFVIQSLNVDRDHLYAYYAVETSDLLTDLREFEVLVYEDADPASPIFDEVLEDLGAHLASLPVVDARYDLNAEHVRMDMRTASLAAQDVGSKLSTLLEVARAMQSGERLTPDNVFQLGKAISALQLATETMVGRLSRVEADLVQHLMQTVFGISVAYVVLVAASATAGLATLLLLRREVRARHERAQAERRAEYLAYFDWTTGVANELQFQDRLASTLSQRVDASVIVVDVDDLTYINDRRGQSFADAMIKEIARRAQDTAEENGGFAARLGGDRFGLFIPNEDQTFVTTFCEEFLDRCQRPVVKGAQTMSPTLSAGVVMLSNAGEARIFGYDSIMKLAHLALHAAKEKGPCSYVIYDDTLVDRFIDRAALAEDLPLAIKTGQIDVFLQPKIELTTGMICGFEALASMVWNGARVPTLDLLVAAEGAGLAVDLERYMLDRAVDVMADWNRRRKTSFAVSLDMSAAHFYGSDGQAFVEDCLRNRRFPAELLTIEITETATSRHRDGLEFDTTRLRALGCRIALDKFGSAGSSLVHLRKLKLDEIKVDRGLLRDLEHSPDAHSVLESVLGLARNLGVETVIEGVDHAGQARIVSQMGCSLVQGLHFGRARPAVEWLADVTYGQSRITSAA